MAFRDWAVSEGATSASEIRVRPRPPAIGLSPQYFYFAFILSDPQILRRKVLHRAAVGAAGDEKDFTAVTSMFSAAAPAAPTATLPSIVRSYGGSSAGARSGAVRSDHPAISMPSGSDATKPSSLLVALDRHDALAGGFHHPHGGGLA